MAVSEKLPIFAPVNSYGADLIRCRNYCREGSLHFGNAFANALFLDRWNLGTSDVYVRNNAEVDAAGRYYILSCWCADG